ncbi:hypothetical protein NDU88_000994 [Pleurodeles waltl]|uniref:Secretin receptor n=1 Tax=Pleurodeles waltl TaxID=8319 RepID=A0AAV7TGL1_PLEWA|nr:hypothetical protein NDU88_000994 [Pleurodeles waltl]
MRPRRAFITCSLLLVFLVVSNSTIGAGQMDCNLLNVIRQEKEQCFELLAEEKQNLSKHQRLMEEGCLGMWDNVSCWPSASIGKTVFLNCPKFLQIITGTKGRIYRNCTSDGWSEISPNVRIACDYGVNDNTSVSHTSYFNKLKDLYTVGYSTSIATLLMALVILGSFRRLRCTRNYIHMHLFVSFILRAMAVFIKDALLFSADETDHCTAYMTGCKMMLVLFQYCIMANYCWLLVEGLYLHTLLFVSFFSEKKYFWWYIAIGWGLPLVFIVTWSACRQIYEDRGCWDINDDASIWWIIRGPVLMSIFINFILFVRIVRILMKKLRTSEVWGSNAGQYKRLAKSTLLLIPLFGVHYIIFVFFPEDVSSDTSQICLSFELALGSFQGFVVAVLYCFLNGEVQFEIQRKWKQWHLKKHFQARQQKHSSSSNGGSTSTQLVPLSKSSPMDQRQTGPQNTSVI